jgi:hypothetical protein
MELALPGGVELAVALRPGALGKAGHEVVWGHVAEGAAQPSAVGVLDDAIDDG